MTIIWLLLTQANLPLLQQELTSSNGRVSPPPSPRDVDLRVAAGRPSTAHHDDAALTPAAGSLADPRHRLWYLGGLVPSALLPRHHHDAAAALELNANGKRTFDRCDDSDAIDASVSPLILCSYRGFVYSLR